MLRIGTRVYIYNVTVTYLTSLSLEVNKKGKKNMILCVDSLPLLLKGCMLRIQDPLLE